MIGYLRGQVLSYSEGKVLISTSTEKGGGAVGYLVVVPQSAGYAALFKGQWIELYIYTHVREDALDLYGFSTLVEKELFTTFLGVTGIGPKGALAILAGSETSSLIQAVLRKDKDFLVRIPGVGKKTAERVILEIGDTVRKKTETGLLVGYPKSESRIGTAPLSCQVDASASSQEVGSDGVQEMIKDAKAALVGLGYRDQEVGFLLSRALAETEAPPARVEDLIRTALRQLA